MSLRDRLSRAALVRFGPARAAALRQQYLAWRARLHPALMLLHGRFDVADLRRHLEARLDPAFEILMVHSSINKFAPMYRGDVPGLLRMLLDLCGPGRTLAMPAFYFAGPGGRGVRETFLERPRFDLRRTPAQTGLLTELFRRTPGVRYSRHPVFRITALGPLAETLTRGHETAGTPAGPGTPFAVMAERRTVILGLGTTPEVITQVHHAEDVLGEAFPVPASSPNRFPMVLVDGADEIPFAFGHRALQWRRNMARLPGLLGRGQLRVWRFHGVPMFMTSAVAVSEGLLASAARNLTLYERP